MRDHTITLPFGIPTTIAIIASTSLIWGLGEGLFIFFLPLTLQRWNSDPLQIGAVLSMIGVMMVFVQAPSGYLSDRFGTLGMILTAMFLGVAASAVMAAAQTWTVFVAGLLAYGCTSLISAPLHSAITRLRGGWSIQRAVTFVSGSMQIGAILGPTLGGKIADTYGLPTIFLYSTVLFALATTVTIIFVRVPKGEDIHDPAAPKISPLTNPRFLILLMVTALTVFAMSTPQQLTSMYLQNVHGLSTQQIGTMGTAASIGTAALMFLLGSLRPTTGMLLGQLFLAAFALLMWRGQSLPAFYAGYALTGGYRLYRSMALAYSRSLVKASDIGLAYGLVETGAAAAVIVAPMAAGYLYQLAPTLVYSASLGALGAVFVLNALFLRLKHPA